MLWYKFSQIWFSLFFFFAHCLKNKVSVIILRYFYLVIEKQPFADVLQYKCSWKFRKFTGKGLCQSLVLIKFQASRLCTAVLLKWVILSFALSWKKFFLQSVSIFHICNVANISSSSISKSKPLDSHVFV